VIFSSYKQSKQQAKGNAGFLPHPGQCGGNTKRIKDFKPKESAMSNLKDVKIMNKY
jgi:hypothetical protein